MHGGRHFQLFFFFDQKAAHYFRATVYILSGAPVGEEGVRLEPELEPE